MKKLEISHVAPYLPHKLEIKVGHISTATMTTDETSAKLIRVSSVLSVEAYQPILRPLSDLTKEITHRGKTFVPEAKIKNMFGDDIPNWNSFNQGWRNDDLTDTIIEHCVFSKLCEWMFDTQNLIGRNLAISVHDLTENPYEK